MPKIDTPQEKILFVDDDPDILQGYQRLLRADFSIDTAVGGSGALISISARGPYAVVVSDMRMPQMSGLQLLCKVKSVSPDTIRILLTGETTIQTAIDAINEGSIFRFLTKPCDKETMCRTLTAALLQFRMVVTENELLEKTLQASIRLLTEVLSLVNPEAFSRAMRLRRYMSHIVSALGLGSPWRFEVAAMMSQLGCVTLDPELIHAVHIGQNLAPDEQVRYDRHPLVAQGLLANIPRMEPIAWMIAHQNRPAPVVHDLADQEAADMRLGAKLLRVALDFDKFFRQSKSRTEAGSTVARRHKNLDPRILHALVQVEPDNDPSQTRTCTIEELSPGMILEEDVYSEHGPLIVAKGQEVTPPLILKLKSFQKNLIGDGVKVTALKPFPSVCIPPATAKGQSSPS
jgi:ActR/RegA family two-component response regulator